MARPKKPSDEKRENTLRIRLTETERQLLEVAAQLRNLDVSTWARSELLTLAKKLTEK